MSRHTQNNGVKMQLGVRDLALSRAYVKWLCIVAIFLDSLWFLDEKCRKQKMKEHNLPKSEIKWYAGIS